MAIGGSTIDVLRYNRVLHVNAYTHKSNTVSVKLRMEINHAMCMAHLNSFGTDTIASRGVKGKI